MKTKRHPSPSGEDAFLFSGVLNASLRRSVEFFLHEPNDLLQIPGSVDEIKVIAFDDEQRASSIMSDPALVVLVQLLEVFALNALFKGASAPRNLLDQGVDRRPEVNHQIGRLEIIGHDLEQGRIVTVVAIVHLANVMQVSGEDLGVLIDRAILDDRLAGFRHALMMLEPVRQEVDLEMERPPFHVAIKVGEVRIVIDRFEIRVPAKPIGEEPRKGGLTGADIACHSHKE